MTCYKYIISIIFLLLLGIGPIFSQESQLIVQANDTTNFMMALNGQQVNDSAVNEVSAVVEPGEILIDLMIANGEQSHISTSVYVSRGKEVIYDLKSMRGKYVLLPVSEIEWTKPKTETNPEEVQDLDADTLTTDSLAADSLNIYQGQKGCSRPASEFRVDQLLREMESSFFESDKKQLATEFVRNQCVRVKQLKMILRHISYEDARLEILKNANIYDLDNFSNLRDLFLLEAMRKRLDEMEAARQ